MAAAKKNFFKDHYDWLVALVGLALLGGVGFLFVSTLDNSPEDARAACAAELKQRPPQHKAVPVDEKTLEVLNEAEKDFVSPPRLEVPNDKKGSFLASECRVYCKNPDRAACHRPIPVKSETCPFCGFKQPQDDVDVARGGADVDNDGMPDAWESKYGFKPLDPSDANQDADGDLFTNVEEYEAKTNPKDPESHPDYLDYLSIVGDLRTDKLPFWFKSYTPTRDNFRLQFVVADKQYRQLAEATNGQEVVYTLAKWSKKGDKVKSGWRVVKFEKKEERVTRRGAGQSVVSDASTVDLERVSDKRVISVKIGVNPISVEEQMDLQWDRGEGKKLTVAKGSEFALGNRKYKVTSLKKGRVTIVDLKTNTEKTIGDGAPEPKSAAKPTPNPKPGPKR